MKRKVRGLTSFEEYEKKLLKNKLVVKMAKKEEYRYQLARSLIKLRLKKKLSQKRLAEMIGSKQPVISRLETGAVKPTMSLLERIAEVLGVDLMVRLG
ncbi:helix-turn-helix domain-containing protein [Patescibacteria group bacterium]|nr:helix-turn-helix domain-containing protein [Patescibacteria group bacterium]MCG2701876.1 helix-turn-helix domain-containing protein [Candidatus Parcubacteria bacterium]MBU4264445.1 helix-turn-helix domain-containing protein [Patescibacteria group bacterium]MBU4390209.1 helix-turn-helix domain-containing protein [Patescibacteria group bacterium]MBU4397211.1 helix-turn-helix domain-containing protein [Patescibacteria group bacterium]